MHAARIMWILKFGIGQFLKTELYIETICTNAENEILLVNTEMK